MAKFRTIIGFISSEDEAAPGVYSEVPTERYYRGDILRNAKRDATEPVVNTGLRLEGRFSIVADPYAYENYSKIRYVLWMGSKWKVVSVEIQRPRLILTIGDLYHGA